jgi:hypothetical protein
MNRTRSARGGGGGGGGVKERMNEVVRENLPAYKRDTHGTNNSIAALKTCFPTIMIASCIVSSIKHPAALH